MTTDVPGNVPLNAGLGAWFPIETAPASGLILLAVEDETGERRTFVAEASHDSTNGGALVWMITTGWCGWARLHSAWRPFLWQHKPQCLRLIFGCSRPCPRNMSAVQNQF